MFTQGMPVLCVDADFPTIATKLYKELPTKGSVYHIRDFAPGITLDEKEEMLVTLMELRNPPDPYNELGLELGFKACRFEQHGQLNLKSSKNILATAI